MIDEDPVNREAGFTLLDVLVALVVAGLAGSILIGLVSFVDRTSARVSTKMQMTEGLLAVKQIFLSLNQQAFSPSFNDPSGSRPRGTEAEFSIRTQGPRILGLDRATVFHLASKPAGNSEQLILTWQDPGTSVEHREVILPDVEEAVFAYLGREKASETRTWRSSWQANDAQLEAVRLSVRTRTMRAPIDIVAPVRATLPSACLRNPRHPGCPLS
jgi:type II secretory pathway component PulJ